jgi:hypothetical protein
MKRELMPAQTPCQVGGTESSENSKAIANKEPTKSPSPDLTRLPDIPGFPDSREARCLKNTKAQARFSEKLPLHFNTFRHATGFLAAWVAASVRGILCETIG